MQFNNQIINTFFVKKVVFISLFGALLGIGISYFILYSELQETFTYTFKDGLLTAVLGIGAAFLLSKTTIFLNRLLPFYNNIGVRLFVGIIVHFAFVFSIVFASFYFYQFFFFEVTTFFERYTSALIKLAIILWIWILIFEVIYFALYSYYSYSKFQIATVKQERKQIELQLKALKSQLSPHFLFNSLNTISSLVFKDTKMASQFIRRLAKMYDFTLKSYHKKLITVQEELDFVNSYIFLLQTRFQNKIHFTVQIDDSILTTKIPPLTLQMLVENAVKHNQLLVNTPLEIQILAEKTVIIVENTITEAPKNVTSFNIGLKNINSRYLLLVNKAISIVKGNTFKVQIPIIE